MSRECLCFIVSCYFVGYYDEEYDQEWHLYIWQLPQNLLGLTVIFFSKAWKDCFYKNTYDTNYKFGVSLGKYIIVYRYCDIPTIKHEQGHQKQSIMLGWFYLFVIGLPSAIGNLLHRKFKFNYYKQPWEAWADKLGGVKR